ncbi:MAG: hypothetical protein ACQEP5_09190 [Actinomycetota bacterium]
MEALKDFFSEENIKELFDNFYQWLESLLNDWFGRIEYEPMKDLLTNPLFWLIIIVLLFFGFVFRRR